MSPFDFDFDFSKDAAGFIDKIESAQAETERKQEEREKEKEREREREMEFEKEREAYINKKLGTLITEHNMREYINKDIFFIGEFVNYKDGILLIKSLNGTLLNCIAQNLVLPKYPKYVGIKGTITNDLKIKETRGVIFMNINDPEIVKQYTDVYMEHINTEVFTPFY